MSNSFAFRLQGVAVKGKLTCGGKPWKNAKVKLFDIDTNPGDPDDLLDEKYTDKDGEFRLDGTTREMTPIDPVLYIYHDCEDSIKVRLDFSR
ncbi:Protein CBG27189 [Caenorhabditis briggsae]|nr:Protein CBG27189 [Caenorhabditis briggsae]CAS00652.1 Protein CBG27189 [Caenorhabditis briggsae]